MDDGLIGLGIYTPAEAGRLLHVNAAKIGRWLRGHRVGAQIYDPLWRPQINIGDGRTYLGFRDLMEIRITAKFISYGISPQRVRAAIRLAREIVGAEHPLSTDRFRTDGRSILFRVIETDEHGEERERLLNLFRRQYEFKQIVDPVLKTIDFDAQGAPLQWWPLGRRGNIVVDPSRALGQPLDAVTSVPTAVLALAAKTAGIERAARAYDVPQASVQRAVDYEATLERQAAA